VKSIKKRLDVSVVQLPALQTLAELVQQHTLPLLPATSARSPRLRQLPSSKDGERSTRGHYAGRQPGQIPAIHDSAGPL